MNSKAFHEAGSSVEGPRFQAIDSLTENYCAVMRAANPERVDPGDAQVSHRPKTRLLGIALFRRGSQTSRQLAEPSVERRGSAKIPSLATVVDGPGRGECFLLKSPTSTIGRGEGQDIKLDFGDEHVSRFAHAVILFDPPKRDARVRDGGKANPVYLNGSLLREDSPLRDGDRLTLGKTTLLFNAV